jgi:prophage regulatory protein
MKYYRFSEIKERGYVTNRMTLSRWIKAGRFPAPVRLGPNTVAWSDVQLAEVDARLAAECDARLAAEQRPAA